MIESFDNYRTGTMGMFIGEYPTYLLVADTGNGTVYGQAAEDQMGKIITNPSGAQSYSSGHNAPSPSRLPSTFSAHRWPQELPCIRFPTVGRPGVLHSARASASISNTHKRGDIHQYERAT